MDNRSIAKLRNRANEEQEYVGKIINNNINIRGDNEAKIKDIINAIKGVLKSDGIEYNNDKSVSENVWIRILK